MTRTIATGKATLYELAAIKGEERILIMYTNNMSRRVLLDCARDHAAKLVALTGDEGLTFGKRSADGAVMGAWKLRWTGRTQREAIQSPLPWIGRAS